MGFKNLIGFKVGKDKAPSVKEAAADKIAVLEERVNGKTRELAEAEQRIKNLSSSAQEIEEEVRPHGPLVELEVQPSTDEGAAEENSEADPLGVVTAEQTPAASTAEAKTAPAPAAPAQPAAAPAAQDDKAFSNLFSQEEEDENPLAALINSLPDVSVKELLNDLHEIKSIIKEMPHR